MVNADAPAFDGADSPMRIGGWDHWERGMALSATSWEFAVLLFLSLRDFESGREVRDRCTV